MGPVSLAAGAAGLALLSWPEYGKFAALGLGLLAMGLGLLAARRGRSSTDDTAAAGRQRARARLLAAGGVTLGAVAALLGGAKIALTIAAVDRIGDLLGS
jgi:hypothetical protein